MTTSEMTSVRLEIDDYRLVLFDRDEVARLVAQVEAIQTEVKRRGLRMIATRDPAIRKVVIVIQGPAKELLQLQESTAGPDDTSRTGPGLPPLE